MKQSPRRLLSTAAVLFLSALAFAPGCISPQGGYAPGADPVVVDAERDTNLAYDAFEGIKKADIDIYPAWKAIDAKSAGAFRTYVNYIRANEKRWLTTARTLTKTYKANRTADNKASLSTYMLTLTAATTEANKYLTKTNAIAPPIP